MNEIMPVYNKDDYENGIDPYEYLFSFLNEPLKHDSIKTQLIKTAQLLGYRGFRKRYNIYCLQVNQTNTKFINNVTHFEGQTLEIDTGSWQTSENGIWRESGNIRMEACSHAILPIERLINIDTGTEKLKIAFKKGNNWREVIADKSTLASPIKIIKLADYGISVTSETAKYLIKYLQEIEDLNYQIIPERYCVSRLGWIDGHGFSPYVDELIFDGDANYRTLFNSVQTKGNKQDWYNIISSIRHTDNNITARIILAASFASVLVKPCGCLTFFVHLWGNESGTGKTVGLMIAASVWANPEIGIYIQTFNSTVVGREKTAAFCNSLPLIIDELQLGKDNNGKQQFNVYALAEGAGRTRSNRDGGLNQTARWSNCIITSGETPITQIGAGSGAMNRVIDIECTSGSMVVDDGHKISNIVRKSYGHAGHEFIECLEKSGLEPSDLYQEYYSELCKTDITEKQAMAAALILTADKLATDWLFHDDRELLPSEIQTFLLSKKQVSANNRAYDFLCDWVQINRAKHFKDNDQEKYGVIEDGIVYIIPTIFEKIMDSEGYSYTGFLSWLKANKKMGLCEQNRNTIRKMIGTDRIRCHPIKVDIPDLEVNPFDL